MFKRLQALPANDHPHSEAAFVHQTLAANFFNRSAILGDRTAVRFKEGRGPWRDLTWTEFAQLVAELAAGLAFYGLNKGQSAAILSGTSYLWVASDLAIMANGAVSVPIYPTSSLSDVKFILENSGACFAFVQSESLLQKVLAVREQLPNLKKIVLLSALSGGKSLSELPGIADIEGLVLGLEELQEAGRSALHETPGLLEQRLVACQGADLATIIYTSGTTGTPKGAMLTYDNISGVLDDLPAVIPVTESDVYLSFLPLSHVFERICGEFFWLRQGDVCAFAEGLEHVAKNMAEIEPTMILVVPRVLDRIYGKVKAGIQGATGRARKLIEWSIAVGKEVFHQRRQGKPVRIGLQAKHWLAEKLVFSKLRSRIGRKLRLVVSGGAPATVEVLEFFNAIGIPTFEGYGLTETSAPVSVNLAARIKPGTVGPALPSVEMKIDKEGEILIKGPGVFKGYFKADELTAQVFDADGWFHTGDIGTIDGDGYLKITDRKKDVIINSSGKNIAPQRIEAIIKTIPVVNHATVFGDKRKTLVALLTLDENAVIELSREKGWNFSNFQDLTVHGQVKEYLRQEIDTRQELLADYEKVSDFAVLPHDLSVEAGELTATLKVKRNEIGRKYKDLVDSLYKQREDVADQLNAVAEAVRSA